MLIVKTYLFGIIKVSTSISLVIDIDSVLVLCLLVT